MTSRRNINQSGLELIRKWESLSLSPYKCPAGIPTIGIGCTYYPDGTKVKLSDPTLKNEKEAYDLLNVILDEIEDVVSNYLYKIKLPVNENQFSALVSFAFNCGVAPVISPGRSLNIALKTKDPKKIADTMLIYCKATDEKTGNKVVLKGLENRRKDERNLFLS